MGADMSKQILSLIGVATWLVVGCGGVYFSDTREWKATYLVVSAFIGLLLLCIAFAIDNDEVKTRNGIFRIIEYLMISILGLFILFVHNEEMKNIGQGMYSQVILFWVLSGLCIIDLVGDVTNWYSTVHISVSRD